MTRQMSEPRTAAGRRLHARIFGLSDRMPDGAELDNLILAIEQRLTVERLHQYLHDEGVWPDDDEAWHLRVCEGALAREEAGE